MPTWHSLSGEARSAMALEEPSNIGRKDCKKKKQKCFTGGWVNSNRAGDRACRSKYSLIFHLLIRSSTLPGRTPPFSGNRISTEDIY